MVYKEVTWSIMLNLDFSCNKGRIKIPQINKSTVSLWSVCDEVLIRQYVGGFELPKVFMLVCF